MEKAISAAEANRHFSEILRAVRAGDSYVVTTHGRPVARIMPVLADVSSSIDARQRLLARLRTEPVMDAERWTREDLYER